MVVVQTCERRVFEPGFDDILELFGIHNPEQTFPIAAEAEFASVF